jgi:hypothetical protein
LYPDRETISADIFEDSEDFGLQVIRVGFYRNLPDLPGVFDKFNDPGQSVRDYCRCAATNVNRIETIAKFTIDFYFFLKSIKITRSKRRLEFDPDKRTIGTQLFAERNVNVKQICSVLVRLWG